MNILRVSKKAILNNLDYLQSLQPHAAIFPVLKSNAYGHWLKQMVRVLKWINVPYLAIDSYPEYQIVKSNSRHRILLLWETLPENYRKFDTNRVTFCVYSESVLEVLWRLKKPVMVHLFLNTGMNREGIDEDQLDNFLEILKQYPTIQVEGVMSHLHSADQTDFELTGEGFASIQKQIDLFKKIYYKILDHGHAPIWRHLWNSAGMFKIKDDFFNAYRPGLALYWYNPLDSQDSYYRLWKNLKPALSIVSRVVSIHTVWPWDGVSYNHKHTFSEREIVASVPFGYSEWLPRSASWLLKYRIWKKTYSQIWTICMNLSSFLADDKIKVWSEVEIISENSGNENSLVNLSQASGCIPYECLVRFDKWMRREIV